MIPFVSSWLSKSKQQWWAAREARIRIEYAAQEAALHQELKAQEAHWRVEAAERRATFELKAAEELKGRHLAHQAALQALDAAVAALDARQAQTRRTEAEAQAADVIARKVLAERQAAIDLAAHRLALQETTTATKQREVALLEQQLATRQAELLAANEEARVHLRELEAKARPDAIWTSAVQLAFSKAWDLLLPLVKQGVSKGDDIVYTEAVNETLAGLEPYFAARLDQLQAASLRPLAAVQAKRQEMLSKRDATKSAEERMRFDHYLTALDWLLSPAEVQNGN